jgi:hypothetical protein
MKLGLLAAITFYQSFHLQKPPCFFANEIREKTLRDFLAESQKIEQQIQLFNFSFFLHTYYKLKPG